MRAVLYTNEMEPLVIIDLPLDEGECLDRGFIQVPVPHKSDKYYIYTYTTPDTTLERETVYKTVTIKVEKMYKDGVYYPLFFVDRKELHDALNLKPSEHFSREEKKEQERVTLEMLVDRLVPGLIKAFEDEQ